MRVPAGSAATTLALLLVATAAPAAAAEPRAVDIRTTTVNGAPAEPGSARYGTLLDDLPYAPGRLILKLTDDAGGRSLHARRAGIAGGGELGVAALDELCRRYAVRSIGRPFAGRDARTVARAGGPTRRAARAPAGAATPGFEHVHVLELSRYLDIEAVARAFEGRPEVVWAEADGRVELFAATNDPFLFSSGKWGQPFRDLWGLESIDVQSAWDVTRGAGVLVAIIDTGIDATHPEISDRLWTNTAEIASNGVDDDGNGYADDTWGWDTYDDDDDPTDEYGHGTHVAGTVAAAGNNATGVVGVAYEATLMAIKAFSAGGTADFTHTASAILYAIDNGADVINASWGAGVPSNLVSDAVEAAAAAGVVFVAAAGNSATDVSSFHPASHPRAISVSAFDSTDALASFSNFGVGIDVAAPGGGDDLPTNAFDPSRSILSLKSAITSESMAPDALVIDELYLRQAGTSMAAPHVAGTAALLLAANPALTAEQVRQALRASTDDVAAPGFDVESGYGRINAGRALLVPPPPEVKIDAPALNAVVGVNSIEISGTVAGGAFISYAVEYGAGDEPVEWTEIAPPATSEVVANTLATWDVAAVPDGHYTIRVRANDGSAYVFEDRAGVVLDRVAITDPVGYTMLRGGVPITIRGTAYIPGLTSYEIEYRIIEPDLTSGPWTSAGIAATAGGAAPVFEDVLATFDSSVLPGGRDLDLRLTLHGTDGAVEETFHHIVVDPTIRAGWPIQLPVQTPFNLMKGHMNVADLDGDGTKEILAAYGDLVYVWRHDGTEFPGWPQSVEDGDLETFEWVESSPAAADLDNDGDLELVIADGEEIHAWHHDGTTMAGWPIYYRLPDALSEFEPTDDVTLVDLDGDGLRDILFPWHHGVGAVRTDGSMLPGWPVTFATNYLTTAMESSIAVGDMTGDGSPEVAFVERHCCGRTGKQQLFVHDAAGNLLAGFPRRVSKRLVDDNWPILVDVNGDGLLDVVTNDSKAKKLRAYDWRGKRRSLRTKIPAYRVRVQTGFGRKRFESQQEPLSAGDIDGDGVAEIFVGTEWPQRHERCSRGRCTWTYLLPPWNGTNVLQAVSSRQRTVPGWPQVWEFSRGDNAHGGGSAAIGDIDGDGAQDVVTGTGMCWAASGFEYHRCYSVHGFNADGTTKQGFPKPTAHPGGEAGMMPAIGDLDGDGLKEIVWADWAGNVVVWNVPGTPGPESIQWSGFRGNPAHTGTLD